MRYFLFAVSFLTLLPVPGRLVCTLEKPWRALAFFPLAGAVHGALAFALFYVLSRILPHKVALVIAIFAYHALNGGLHIDGLVDFADAFFGAKKNPERFREILKDSRIGTMGAFALLCYFFILFTALERTEPDIRLFVGLGMAGRVCIVLCACFSKALFADGMGRTFVENAGLPELAGGLVTYAIAVVLLGLPYLAACVAVVAFGAIYRLYILKRWGGFSGDLLGAGCCVAELVFVCLRTVRW